MAIRGKVKDIRNTGGNNYTGTVTDTAAKIDYTFEQPMGSELGLVENMIVRMEVITKIDGSKLAVSLDPVDKAKIESLDPANNSGTLKNNLGVTINFMQNYITELGLKVGDKVSYTLVPDSSGLGTASGSGDTSGGLGTASGSSGSGGLGTANMVSGTAVCIQKVS